MSDYNKHKYHIVKPSFYIFFNRGWSTERYIIHINFAIAQLSSQIMFVVGATQVTNPVNVYFVVLNHRPSNTLYRISTLLVSSRESNAVPCLRPLRSADRARMHHLSLGARQFAQPFLQ